MDQIHDAFVELLTLGIITDSDEENVTIDLEALYSLGYVLVYNLTIPVFTTILNYNYMYDGILYTSNVVPRRALSTFVLSKIQTIGVSDFK
ncbi:OrNV gp062-like protein [Tomelloso virus]|uniref:OrNV gp062-like protein n=1 Tax=Tomelloso virus TaxID=2053981 RepID=A0A2H4T2W1_9VIRU|nr:OrNV gp062-like protein [Tomelloso virus]ATY70265.1 OrNV gp062-like protein [Tomelloso virus]